MRDGNSDLQAKPVGRRIAGWVAGLLCLFVLVPGGMWAAGRQTVVTFVVYPDPYPAAGELRTQVLSLRDKVRTDRRFIILPFDTDSPTFTMAARTAAPPVTLKNDLSADERASVALSAGAAFYAEMTRSGKTKNNIALALFRAGAPDRSLWRWTGTDMDEASAQITQAMLTALASAKAPAVTVAPPTDPTVVGVTPAPPAPAPTAGPIPPVPAIPAAAPPVVPTPPAAPDVISTDVPVNVVQVVPQRLTPAAPPVPVAPAATIVPAPAVIPNSPVVAVDVTPITVAPVPVPVVVPPNDMVGDESLVAGNHAPTTFTKSDARDHLTISDDAHKKVIMGNSALQQSDLFGAIDAYRQAVNLSPYSTDIRLKLADVYVQAGYPKQGLDEARRALTLDPNSGAMADFIASMKQRGLVPDGDATILLASVARDPDNAQSWLDRGDSYLAAMNPDKARDAYDRAVALQPAMPEPQGHLVRLYVTTGQYDQALDAYAKAGSIGYNEALRITSQRADNLLSDLHRASSDYDARTSTREGYYRTITQLDSRARSLASFVGKLTPPSAQKVAYLHLKLGTGLVSQVTATWVSFVETNDTSYRDQAQQLELDVKRELKTASIAARSVGSQ